MGYSPDSSHLRPYDSRHQRHFDFTEVKALGSEFVSAFAQAFIRYSSSIAPGTAQSSYCSALNLLRWIKDNKENLRNLVSVLRSDHTKASVKDWEDAAALWRSNLLGKSKPGPVTKDGLIKEVNTVLKKMSVFGVIPKLTYIGSPKNLRRAARPTKSLAELPQQNLEEGARKILEEALSGAKGSDVEIQVRRDFLTTLLSETGEIKGAGEDQAKALMKINSERLNAVRKCASEDYKKWRDHWLRGQHLLQSCDMSFEEIDSVVNRPYQNKVNRGKDMAALFPTDNPDQSLARLLRYFTDHPVYRGRIMRRNKRVLKCFRKQIPWFGGIEVVQAYLFPHPELVTAAIVIFLCDTGANVSVARTLPRDCMEDSKESGYKVIKGIKMRAHGKLIINELPVKDRLHEISCVEVIQTCQRISESLSKLAVGENANFLFLYVGWRGSISTVGNHQWNGFWFRRFRNRHAELRKLNLQSKMIRPSVLLQAEFDKETGIIAAAAAGDHSALSITARYISRFPNQLIWEQKMREFQSLFQVISIQSIKGAAEKLGLTEDQVKNLLSQAHRTGLGVACLDPISGIQPGSEKGEICTQLPNCPGCPNRFVVATVEHLKDLILMNRHLEQHRSEWERTRPERWGKVWLPWLAFTHVAIEQAGRGRTLNEYRKARILADEQIAEGEVNLPPLW